MSNDIPKIPNQKDYKNLTPFDLALIQRFPFIEEDFDAINLYGIISKIKDYLNQLIANEQIVTENQKNVYNSFVDLHNYVEDYFTNLDVQEEINNKLDEMAQNGVLSEIIKFQNNKLIPEYVMTRYMKCTDDYITPNNLLAQEIEGICKTENNKILAFYSPVKEGITQNSSVLVEEYDISQKYHPSKIRYSNITGLQHANSACFDSINNKIYVALWGYFNNNVEVNTNKIAKINYNTLEIEDIIEINELQSISKIAFYNNCLYVQSANSIYKYENDILSYLFDIDVSGSQGFDIFNNMLYVASSNPSLITVYNLLNASKLKQYSINEFDNTGKFMCAYMSDLTVIDADNLIITPHFPGEYLTYTSDWQHSYECNYIEKINLNGQGLSNTTINNFFIHDKIVVDTNNVEDCLYATGSTTFPLKLISEYLFNYYKKLLDFRLENVGTLEYFGVLRLINQNLKLDTNIVCHGLNMKNAKLDGQVITVNDRIMDVRGSQVCGSSLILNYNGDDKHLVQYSNINVNNITNNVNIESRGSTFIKRSNKIDYYNNSLLAIVPSTITKEGPTLTADFSSHITSTNFDPGSYFVLIGLSSGENLVHPITYGLGNNRISYDKDGNGYRIKTYDKNSKTLQITGDSIDNISVVTLLTI